MKNPIIKTFIVAYCIELIILCFLVFEPIFNILIVLFPVIVGLLFGAILDLVIGEKKRKISKEKIYYSGHILGVITLALVYTLWSTYTIRKNRENDNRQKITSSLNEEKNEHQKELIKDAYEEFKLQFGNEYDYYLGHIVIDSQLNCCHFMYYTDGLKKHKYQSNLATISLTPFVKTIFNQPVNGDEAEYLEYGRLFKLKYGYFPSLSLSREDTLMLREAAKIFIENRPR